MTKSRPKPQRMSAEVRRAMFITAKKMALEGWTYTDIATYLTESGQRNNADKPMTSGDISYLLTHNGFRLHEERRKMRGKVNTPKKHFPPGLPPYVGEPAPAVSTHLPPLPPAPQPGRQDTKADKWAAARYILASDMPPQVAVDLLKGLNL